MDENNGWTDENERLLASKGEKLKGLVWMHDKSREKYSKLNSLTGFINIGISATATFVATSLCTDLIDSNIYPQLLTFLTALSATSATVNQFMDFEERSRSHDNYVKLYDELASDIEIQLTKPRSYRENGLSYVDRILIDYNRTNKNCPTIPNNVSLKFEKIFKDAKIAKPEINDRIDPINIGNGLPPIDSDDMKSAIKFVPNKEYIDIQSEFEKRKQDLKENADEYQKNR